MSSMPPTRRHAKHRVPILLPPPKDRQKTRPSYPRQPMIAHVNSSRPTNHFICRKQRISVTRHPVSELPIVLLTAVHPPTPRKKDHDSPSLPTSHSEHVLQAPGTLHSRRTLFIPRTTLPAASRPNHRRRHHARQAAALHRRLLLLRLLGPLLGGRPSTAPTATSEPSPPGPSSWTGNYGLNNRLDGHQQPSPTSGPAASQGVLHPQSGFQDFSAHREIQAHQHSRKEVRRSPAPSWSQPEPCPCPTTLPTSSRSRSVRRAAPSPAGGPSTTSAKMACIINGSTAYTFRGNVTLDRSSYYTNNQLYLSNQVAMPNQFEYTVSAGYRKNETTLTGNFTSSSRPAAVATYGARIHPFVSNRVNFSKAGFYPHLFRLPRVRAAPVLAHLQQHLRRP